MKEWKSNEENEKKIIPYISIVLVINLIDIQKIASNLKAEDYHIIYILTKDIWLVWCRTCNFPIEIWVKTPVQNYIWR